MAPSRGITHCRISGAGEASRTAVKRPLWAAAGEIRLGPIGKTSESENWPYIRESGTGSCGIFLPGELSTTDWDFITKIKKTQRKPYREPSFWLLSGYLGKPDHIWRLTQLRKWVSSPRQWVSELHKVGETTQYWIIKHDHVWWSKSLKYQQVKKMPL